MQGLFKKTVEKIEKRKLNNKHGIAQNEKNKIVEQYKTLTDYKEHLEKVNKKAETMFNSMSEIKNSSLSNMKLVDKAVIQGEANFMKYLD